MGAVALSSHRPSSTLLLPPPPASRYYVVVAAIVLIAGMTLLGWSCADFVLHSVAKETLSKLGVGLGFTFLSFLCFRDIGQISQKSLEASQASLETTQGSIEAAAASNLLDRWESVGPYQTVNATLKGDHEENQDSAFCVDIESGVLVGVFDGHGTKGEAISGMGKTMFATLFKKQMENSDIATAFKNTVTELHQDAGRIDGGAVMVACYIDYATRKRYTATLGDCEVRVYRKDQGRLTCKKLSQELTWNDPSMKAKLEAHNKAEGYTRATVEPGQDKPYLRIQPTESRPDYVINTTNFTASIGDAVGPAADLLERAPIIHEDEALPGDLMIAMSDGVSDFDGNIVRVIDSDWGKNVNLAQLCVDHATHNKKGDANWDDRTAVCLFIPTEL